MVDGNPEPAVAIPLFILCVPTTPPVVLLLLTVNTPWSPYNVVVPLL